MRAGSSAGEPAAASAPGPVTRSLPPRLGRAPLLALAALSMLTGVAGGLARLGVDMPAPAADLTLNHGPLMVAGLFGTVIGLERAVAAGARWTFLAPLASGLAGLVLAAGGPVAPAAGLFVLAGLVMLAGALVMAVRHPALHTAVLAGGGACWLAGNLVWLAGRPLAEAVPWWIGFLVLVIAGERLELSRLLKPPPGRTALFLAAAALLAGGIALSSLDRAGELAPVGPGLLALAAWLLRFDIARRTVRQSGLVRYVAVCLLGGYVWLAAGGLLALSGAAFARDAALHAVFLGFVLTMVFAHAPIILPALLKVAVPYRRLFYLHVAILHGSLVLRMLADLMGWVELRACGGLGNAVAILAFAAMTVTSAVRGRTAGRRGQPPAP